MRPLHRQNFLIGGIGGIVYYIVYNFVILLGLKTDYLKMLSAIIVDVSGEEKAKLTVEHLLSLFAKASGDEFFNDRAILS